MSSFSDIEFIWYILCIFFCNILECILKNWTHLGIHCCCCRCILQMNFLLYLFFHTYFFMWKWKVVSYVGCHEQTLRDLCGKLLSVQLGYYALNTFSLVMNLSTISEYFFFNWKEFQTHKIFCNSFIFNKLELMIILGITHSCWKQTWLG